MKKITLILTLCSWSFLLQAQKNFWTYETSQSVSVHDGYQKQEIYAVQLEELRLQLQTAPSRFEKDSQVAVSLPLPGGEFQKFKIFEASNMAPELQRAFPEIHSYIAIGIDDPTAVARIAISPFEFYATIESGTFSPVNIERTNTGQYAVSIRKDYGEDLNFACDYIELEQNPQRPSHVLNANDGLLRTYRLAVSATSDYSAFHLQRLGISPSASVAQKKAAVISAINLAMTKINGVFERDVAIHMQLVANNDAVIFLDPAGDPFTYNDKSANIAENQTVCENYIGNDNYDLGHVFSGAHYGGLAYMGAVCWYPYKAGAATGLAEPFGDSFYMVGAHEMGHQFGANHTFNNSCGGNNNPNTGIEPGSGTTIMSYAGACPPNVASDRIHFFNSLSIQEMWSNITRGNSQCGVTSPTNNAAPVASTGSQFTIPKSTPFILEGIATDPDDPTGAGLTYSWEQFNPQQAPMPPKNTNTMGPLFLINEPISVPYRYMPKMETILIGATENRWEVVPSVERIMNFRFLVRDNAPGGSSTASAGTRVSVDGNAGPFIVTSHNNASTWTTKTSETITWDVAGTNSGRVNCSEVQILFSTDGGYTYPHILADGVPNNGSATIAVPKVNTTTGRVMVRGKNNIFFDINNKDIVVTGELDTNHFEFENFSLYPNPGDVFNLKFTTSSSAPVELSLYDINGRIIDKNVYDEKKSSFEKKLDYSFLHPGVYFLVIKNGEGSTTKKLIKK